MVGSWSRDKCATQYLNIYEKDGFIFGESKFNNGANISYFEIDPRSLNVNPLGNEKYKFDFTSTNWTNLNPAKFNMHIVQESGSNSRKVMEARRLSDGVVVVKNGIVLHANVPFAEEMKCN